MEAWTHKPFFWVTDFTNTDPVVILLKRPSVDNVFYSDTKDIKQTSGSDPCDKMTIGLSYTPPSAHTTDIIKLLRNKAL